MSGHHCPDCQTCPNCGRSAWCEGDRILVIPCEHHGYCGECHLELCQDCRLDAEAHMYRSGEYDAGADPFFRPERKAADDQPRNLAGFDPATNSYRRTR